MPSYPRGSPSRRLALRLKTLGIRVGPARNASLMELARELPAYVFSRRQPQRCSRPGGAVAEASAFDAARRGPCVSTSP